MKFTKTLAACSVLAASTGLSSIAVAESPLTGNIGVTSNYVWRGATQSNDEAAVSGGIDYAADFGLYVGTWVSNLSGGDYEQDWYAGYSFEAGPVGLDVGYIAYTYPVGTTNENFDEVYLNASWKMLSGGVALTVDGDSNAAEFSDDDLYLYIGADFEVAEGLSIGVLYGDYDFDDPAGVDYSHIQVSVSKDDFTFAIEDNDKDGAAGDSRFTVSWSKSFDLL